MNYSTNSDEFDILGPRVVHVQVTHTVGDDKLFIQTISSIWLQELEILKINKRHAL